MSGIINSGSIIIDTGDISSSKEACGSWTLLYKGRESASAKASREMAEAAFQECKTSFGFDVSREYPSVRLQAVVDYVQDAVDSLPVEHRGDLAYDSDPSSTAFNSLRYLSHEGVDFESYPCSNVRMEDLPYLVPGICPTPKATPEIEPELLLGQCFAENLRGNIIQAGFPGVASEGVESCSFSLGISSLFPLTFILKKFSRDRSALRTKQRARQKERRAEIAKKERKAANTIRDTYVAYKTKTAPWFFSLTQLDIDVETGQRTCPISMEPVNQYNLGVIQECGHGADYRTLQLWLEMNSSCPQCRTAVTQPIGSGN